MSARLVHPPLQPTLPLRLLLLSLLVLISLPAAAAQIEWTWRAEPALRTLADGEDLSALVAGQPWHTETAERPALPLYPLSLAIPSGERVASVRLVDVLSDRIALSAGLPAFAGAANEDGLRRALALPPATASSRRRSFISTAPSATAALRRPRSPWRPCATK